MTTFAAIGDKGSNSRESEILHTQHKSGLHWGRGIVLIWTLLTACGPTTGGPVDAASSVVDTGALVDVGAVADATVTPLADAAAPAPDALASQPADASPQADGPSPSLDATLPTADATPPTADASTPPHTDAATPPPADAATPPPADAAAQPLPDAISPFPADAVLPALPDLALPPPPLPDAASPNTLCGDEYSPARPHWGEVVQPHLDGNSPYPDYKTISNNLNLSQTLKLLASIVSKATEKLESVQEYVDGSVSGNLFSADELPGHCVCNGCDVQGVPEQIWDTAESALQDALHNLPNTVTDVLQDLLDSRIQFMMDSITATIDSILLIPESVIQSIELAVEARAQAVIDHLIAAGVGVIGFDPAVYAAELTASYDELRTEFEASFGAVRTAIQALRDLDWQQMKTDVQALLHAFQGVNSLEDLTHMDFGDAKQRIANLTAQIQSVAPQVQAAVDAVTTLYSTVMDKIARAREIAEEVSAALQAAMQTNLTAQGVPAMELQAALDELDALPNDIELAVRAGFFLVLDELDELWEDAQTCVDGNGLLADAGELALAQVQAQLVTPITDAFENGLEGCYGHITRAECDDMCAGDVFVWMPNDTFKDPKAAGAAALFVLKQLGWLDKLAEVVGGDSAFADAMNGALGALSTASTFIANLQDILDTFLAHVNHYTEGYHLGAYDTLRPDLHMCVGYAGHGVFAQMGGLGNDQVSIGARYSSHNLSRKHRAQFRTGGFAVSAYGHALSLAPTIEINKQIDAWRLWDAQKPFGIPLAATIPAGTFDRYDVFHLLEDADLTPFQDGSGNIPLGSFIVRDLYGATYDPGTGATIWPRPDAAGEPWEGKSTGVISLGLNLKLDLEPQRWDLPAIQIIPGVLTAIPFFKLAAGVEWIHEASRFLTTIRDKINEGLSPAEQLTDADFAREMHDFQAPDLTADDGTTAYVEPEIGLTAFLGFNIWKIRIGAGADLSLSVNVQPGGFGGILDMNSALADLLMQSNPPADAPCDPVMETTTVKTCSNALYKDPEGQSLSAETYACEPEGERHSCCVQLAELRFCIDEWTGITEDNCKLLNLRDETREQVADALEKIPSNILPGLQAAIDDVLNSQAATFTLTGTWNPGSCSEAQCPTDFTTAYVNIQALSACEHRGLCTYEDGTVVHDVTQEECEAPKGESGCYARYSDVDAPPPANLWIFPGQISWSEPSVDLMGTPEWTEFNELLAQVAAEGIDDPRKCAATGWCVNYTYMPYAWSSENGHVQNDPQAFVMPATAHVTPSDFPIATVGAGVGPQGCPRGLDEQGLPLGDRLVGRRTGTSPSRWIPFVWQAGTPGGSFTPYSCVNHIEETLTGWQGPGCSPLQNGFMSACGCDPEAEGADCAAGESCGEDGRCVGAGGVSDCTCDPDDAGGCGAGRTCRSGACVKLCAADADCATGRVCEAGGCVPPLGVPTAEQIQWGMQNVTAPLHTIASYALSEIEALLRFKLGLYVEASIKLIKEKKWRLLDFARVYDLGSTRKLWFQPGLEARYQHTCTQAVGEGMTNRFPIAPTEALSSVLGFETPGVDPARSCFLAGGVCRYPDDAGEWAALPPVDQRPEDFAQGNAGTLEDFVAWCKADMPANKEDPSPNTDDDLISSVTDTWQFGQDVGMTLWAQNQMCVDGQVWTDWMAGLPDNFGDYDCVYDDPRTGSHHTFPCTELNEEMLLIWGCLSADAAPVDPAAAIALRDRFDGSPAPDITYLHPDFGTVFDPDSIFGFTSVTYPDGSSALEFQYTYDAMLPAVRYYHGSFPFFSPNLGERWLRAVEQCFDDRANDPAESACECATDDECNAQDGERCRLGRCESPHTDAAGVTVWTASQCSIVSLAVEVGPCCGDGTVENNGTYVEACDDGNTDSGDGCSAACQVEEIAGPCHRDGAGACVNDCPQGKVCDAACNTCVAIEPPPCQLANGICGDKCPNGQVCDADCRACVDAPARACGRNAAGVCENHCPDGEICDRACQACVSPAGGGGVDPIRACQQIGDRCLDQCPEGRHCDDTCRACVADVVECAVNALGVCENQCPAGLVCDPTCTVCVDPPPAAECQLAAGQCLDACPEGQTCSPDCRGCVEAPPPCFPGPDGACGDRCPAGLECDALCQGCVRPVFAGPCFMDPDQPGVCIDECRPGQACDADCRQCVNVVPCSLENNVCTTNCPAGQVCDKTCTQCQPEDQRGYPCQVNAEALCLSSCIQGFACDETCQTCGPDMGDCRNTCHQEAIDAGEACITQGGIPANCAAAATEGDVFCRRTRCNSVSDCETRCLGDAFRVWFTCAQRLGGPPFDQCDVEALGSVIGCRNINACP